MEGLIVLGFLLWSFLGWWFMINQFDLIPDPEANLRTVIFILICIVGGPVTLTILCMYIPYLIIVAFNNLSNLIFKERK